jgi:D-3-phosphoglycerate dehydrogenase
VLGAAVLQGILAPILDQPVNLLNAAVLAQERGLKLRLRMGESDERFANVVRVEYRTDRADHRCAGAVFSESHPRIVEIDGFHCEVRPEGNLLVYVNADRPGILAGEKINIGGLSLGRVPGGKHALTVIATDERVSVSVLKEIAQVNGVSKVRFIRL